MFSLTTARHAIANRATIVDARSTTRAPRARVAARAANADRELWYPGAVAPKYLDGTMAAITVRDASDARGRARWRAMGDTIRSDTAGMAIRRRRTRGADARGDAPTRAEEGGTRDEWRRAWMCD